MCGWCARSRSGAASKSVCDDYLDGPRGPFQGAADRKAYACSEEIARVMQLYTLIVSRHPDLSAHSPSALFAALAIRASSSPGTREAIREVFAP